MIKTIETKRLVIRNFSADDADDLYEYLSDAEVVRYEPYGVFTQREAAREAKRRAADDCFPAVCLKSGKLIGNLYLSEGSYGTWELGYVFNRAYWGSGYATEAARAMVRHAFEKLGARRITAMCNPKNEHSWRLLERIPMRREGTLIKNIFFDKDEEGRPIWQDTYEYAVLREEIIPPIGRRSAR